MLKLFITRGFQESTRRTAERNFSAPIRINSCQDFSIFTSIRLQKGGPKPQKIRRASRAETLILLVFSSFLLQNGVPKSPNIRRASRAETLILLGVSSFLLQKGVPKPSKKKGALRAPDSAGRGAQPAMSGVDSGRKKFFLSSINLARGQKKQNCFFFHQPGPSSQKTFWSRSRINKSFFLSSTWPDDVKKLSAEKTSC